MLPPMVSPDAIFRIPGPVLEKLVFGQLDIEVKCASEAPAFAFCCTKLDGSPEMLE